MIEELRTKSEFTLRGDDESDSPITGVAAPFFREGDSGTQYELWPGAVERYMPDAFSESIKNDDIRASFNHNLDALLGRTKSGTLRLSVSDRGLEYEITPSDTSTFRDLRERIKRGDIDGSSIWFEVRSETWRNEGDLAIREINDARLIEVGPVTIPAYSGTSAESRSAARESYEAFLREAEDPKAFLEMRQRELDLISLLSRAARITIGASLSDG